MKTGDPTRKAQARFIKVLRRGDKTLRQVQLECGISRWRLGRWLADPDFESDVKAAGRPLRAVDKLEMSMVQAVAVKNASRCVKTPARDVRAIAQNIKFAIGTVRARRKSRRAVLSGRQVVRPPLLPQDRDRILAKLREND